MGYQWIASKKPTVPDDFCPVSVQDMQRNFHVPFVPAGILEEL
jgi:hypothetical protein